MKKKRNPQTRRFSWENELRLKINGVTDFVIDVSAWLFKSTIWIVNFLLMYSYTKFFIWLYFLCIWHSSHSAFSSHWYTDRKRKLRNSNYFILICCVCIVWTIVQGNVCKRDGFRFFFFFFSFFIFFFIYFFPRYCRGLNPFNRVEKYVHPSLPLTQRKPMGKTHDRWNFNTFVLN